MTKQYTFDFSKFNVSHLLRLQGPSEFVKMAAIHELTVGGIMHLSMSELSEVLWQFLIEYEAFCKHVKAELAGRAQVDDDVLRGIGLDDIKGL